MMSKTEFPSRLIVGWATVVAVMVVDSIGLNAALWTTAFLLALGIAPGILIMMLSDRATSPTVAEILHSVETEGRP